MSRWNQPRPETALIRAKFQERRKAQRLSLNDVAEHLGISKQAINNWERGTHTPSEIHLQEACHVLGLDFTEFNKAWRH